MKKLLTFSLMAAAVCALASCSKTEITPAAANSQTVGFTPLNGKFSTKAMIDGTAYKTSDPTFGTLAYYLPKDKNWQDNMDEAELYVPISEVSYLSSASTWSTATPYYWPKTGSLTFFSYSPYKYQEAGSTETLAIEALSGNDGIQIEGYNVDAHQDTDFMVADIAKDKTANETNGGYKGVPTVFRHKLSQIVGINFLTVGEDASGNLVEKDYAYGDNGGSAPYKAGDVVFKLKKVTVNDLCTTGIYGYTNTTATTGITDGWYPDYTSPKTYTWYDKSSAPEQFTGNTKFNLTYKTHDSSRNSYLLILPQYLSDPKGTIVPAVNPSITIEYQVLTYTSDSAYATENVSETIYLYNVHNKASAIEMNKKITYTFKINLEDRRIYWAPSIIDWESEDSFTATI